MGDKAHPSVLAVAVLCAAAAGFAALLEIGAAACAPAGLFAGYAAFWTLVLLPLLLRRRSRVKFAMYAALLVWLAVLHVVPWNSRKPFLRDFAKVRVGMTGEEVEAIMGGYLKGTGWPAIPGATSPTGQLVEVGSGVAVATSVTPSGELAIRDSITYRHSNDGAFNSDWGVVTFRKGRVIATRFMPD